MIKLTLSSNWVNCKEGNRVHSKNSFFCLICDKLESGYKMNIIALIDYPSSTW